jgi:hypothetical protein
LVTAPCWIWVDLPPFVFGFLPLPLPLSLLLSLLFFPFFPFLLEPPSLEPLSVPLELLPPALAEPESLGSQGWPELPEFDEDPELSQGWPELPPVEDPEPGLPDEEPDPVLPEEPESVLPDEEPDPLLSEESEPGPVPPLFPGGLLGWPPPPV